MPLPLVVLVLASGVLCLTPVAMYLSWVGGLHRKPRPTVVGGGWDFAALLAGLSGLVLFGGGVLVAAFHSNVRYAARGNWEQLQAVWGQERVAWAAFALGYVVVVVGTVALVARSRQRSVAVYNLDRDRAEAAVSDVLADAGVNATRFGDVWSDGRGVVAIDAFDALRHVTVRFVSPDPRLCEELDRGLRKRLATVPSADHRVAGLMYSAAVACSGAIACCLALIAYFLYLTR